MLSRKLRILDLFSGIGGFSLGLEATGGFETVAFCEINEYADAVLKKHWPNVISYEDVSMITKERLAQDEVGQIDLICGGFPCQDISLAGKGAGLKGKRSRLWFEFARIIKEVGPQWVIIENVPALRSRGFVTILQNLSAIGYDAEWHCIPASHVGAPHRRDRIWIVAYPTSQCRSNIKTTKSSKYQRSKKPLGRCSSSMANSESKPTTPIDDKTSGVPSNVPNDGFRSSKGKRPSQRESATPTRWLPEPDVGRMAHGIPSQMDRLKCLGNAIVPQVVEIIGYAILEAENHAQH